MLDCAAPSPLDPPGALKMAPWWRAVRAAAAALAINAGLANLPANAQAPRPDGPLVIVFDGSGSMWGEIEGTRKNKMTVAREALAAAVRSELPRRPVGLVTFGARSGGSCRSIDVAVAPEAGGIDAVERALERFNPQGRGPVTGGLEAARDLIADQGGGRILLVHDGADNCNGDTCAFAAALARDRPGVAVDVLSLALEDAERNEVQCLARATGGRWIEADNADDVAEGARTLLAAFAGGGAVTEAGRPARQPGAPEAPSARTTRERTPTGARAKDGGNLTLAAVLAATGVALPSGAKWRVKALAEARGEAQGAVGEDAFERTFDSAVVAARVPPGRYEVTLETRAGRETRTVAIEAGQQPAEVRIELEGGFLDIKAIAPAADGLAPVATVEALAGGDAAPGNVIWSGPLGEAGGFLLTAGRYRVSLADGLKRTAQTISLKTGEARALALDFNPARLNVRVEGLDARQRGVAVIEIAADDPTAPGGRRLVTRSAAGRAAFSLAPGTYHVTLDVFGARHTEIVVLPAGETVETRLALSQMALTVASYIGETNEVTEENVHYTLWQADDLTRPIRVVQEAQPVFYLAPGKYRIESRIGQQNAVIIREFDIARPGQGRLPLRHEAGAVTFEALGGEAIADNNAYWELKDQSGRLVWRTIAASPTMTLAAGLYDVEVQSAQKTYRGKFLVVAGHDQTVTLSEE